MDNKLTLEKLYEVLNEYYSRYIPETGYVMGRKQFNKFKKRGWIDKNNEILANFKI